MINTASLETALRDAGAAHHEYETNYLSGERDEMWPGWYAAFVLGRLGDFAPPTDLARWLEDAPLGGDWASDAADLIVQRLAKEA